MTRRLRTAVLVVHGMGSQRPLDTVRGVINAAWFDDDDHTKGTKKLWSHPEPSGVDLDLTVMTTNDFKAKTGARVADFHELYWAHLMSETKAVAVLLWLFELGRRGPFFKTGMNGLWWCGAVYLCLLLLSISLLALQAIVFVTGITDRPYDFLFVLALMLFIAVLASTAAAAWYRYWKLSLLLVVGLLIFIGVGGIAVRFELFTPGSHTQLIMAGLTKAFLAPALALLAASILMKKWGRCAFALTYGLSFGFFIGFLLVLWIFGVSDHGKGSSAVYDTIMAANVAWGLPSHASTIAAFTVIGVYFIINAAFLQPYLGDAARYFRNSPANVAVRRAIRKNAVDTLEQLHACRDYDRIVVMAHSLGTVVAYDMLRAYYSRICRKIPVDKTKLNPEFDAIDGGPLECAVLRSTGRGLIRKLAAASTIIADAARQGAYQPAEGGDIDAWLVTDFVTVGSALTHARYLMVQEDNADKLEQDFLDGVRERASPTCPPQKLDGDGLLGFTDPAGAVRLHHGGMFGMTRWTNIYFPIVNIFWGDAIGGPLAPVFGGCIADVPVWTNKAQKPHFFTHTFYWKTDCPEKRDAPHIQALRAAINLEDKP